MNGSIDVSSYGGELSYSYLPTNWIVPLVQYAVVKYDDTFNEIDLFDPPMNLLTLRRRRMTIYMWFS